MGRVPNQNVPHIQWYGFLSQGASAKRSCLLAEPSYARSENEWILVSWRNYVDGSKELSKTKSFYIAQLHNFHLSFLFYKASQTEIILACNNECEVYIYNISNDSYDRHTIFTSERCASNGSNYRSKDWITYQWWHRVCFLWLLIGAGIHWR